VYYSDQCHNSDGHVSNDLLLLRVSRWRADVYCWMFDNHSPNQTVLQRLHHIQLLKSALIHTQLEKHQKLHWCRLYTIRSSAPKQLMDTADISTRIAVEEWSSSQKPGPLSHVWISVCKRRKKVMRYNLRKDVHCASKKMHQLWNGTAQIYMDCFWWHFGRNVQKTLE